ncbi:hypothetical protein Tco_0994652 [Tanacetum coccineum]
MLSRVDYPISRENDLIDMPTHIGGYQFNNDSEASQQTLHTFSFAMMNSIALYPPLLDPPQCMLELIHNGTDRTKERLWICTTWQREGLATCAKSEEKGLWAVRTKIYESIKDFVCGISVHVPRWGENAIVGMSHCRDRGELLPELGIIRFRGLITATGRAGGGSGAVSSSEGI